MSETTEEKWIWEVSVRGCDWEETYTDNQSDAHRLLDAYFDDSENDGDIDISPTFRKFLATDFKKVCPGHGTELVLHDGRLFCQTCCNEGEDPYPATHEFTFNKVKS
jgi:hypothetical protein